MIKFRDMIPSDEHVTAQFAREVLTIAKHQGLAGYCWKVGGGTLPRGGVWEMMWSWIKDIPDQEVISPIFAFRIRQEFGVDGKKKARKQPYRCKVLPAPRPWPRST